MSLERVEGKDTVQLVRLANKQIPSPALLKLPATEWRRKEEVRLVVNSLDWFWRRQMTGTQESPTLALGY